jgi:PKD repeat protein
MQNGKCSKNLTVGFLRKWVALTALTFMILGLAPATAQASHYAGADITLTCVNACTTRVHGRIYYDCVAGSYMPAQFHISPQPGCTAPPALAPNSTGVITDITPTCPSISWCASGNPSAIGIEQLYWYRDYDICAVAPCIFTVSWTDCCRGGILQNINTASSPFYVATTFNTYLSTCNSMPQFLAPPVSWISEGRDSYIFQGATDADGDSLSYELGPCMADSATSVTYLPGCFSSGPFGPGWDVTIDPYTGVLFFDAHPGPAYNGVICIYVLEWRNGALLTTTTRDMMFMTQPYSSINAQPHFTSTTVVSGQAPLVGNTYWACVGSSFCMDIAAQDSDATQQVRMWWDAIMPGATFTDASNGSIHDTLTGTGVVPPVGRLCWTPQTLGFYTVRIHFEDDYCNQNGRTDHVITIGVYQGSVLASASVVGCNMASFALQSCGTPSSYNWSGAGGLSSTLANPVHTYPGPGSYPWQVIYTLGTITDTLYGTATVGNAPTYQSIFQGIAFVAPCSGTVYDTLDGGNFVQWHWSTGDTSRYLQVAQAGNYRVTVTDVGGCQYYDSTLVYSVPADIAGHVSTSTGDILQNQKVYLISMDTNLQALFAIDSIHTDSNGYYYFCNVQDTIVLVKAAPDSADNPTQMPTYADTSLTWANAIQFFPLVQSPLVHDFMTLFGANPSGPGFIGGLIIQGANKANAIGDPVAGLRVFLIDRTTGDVLAYRDSDVNGYFAFPNIPLGDYAIVPDRYGVSVTNVPHIVLTAQAALQDSLDFELHSSWLELVTNSTEIAAQEAGFEAKAMPNPFANAAQLQMRLTENATVQIQVLDALGRKVDEFIWGKLVPGMHVKEIGTQWVAGIYFVQIRVDDAVHVLRVMKGE